jgi:hypothetical protein
MAQATVEPSPTDSASCGYLCVDGIPLDTTGDAPPDTELVKQIFLGAFSESCSWAIGGGPGQSEPKIFDLTFRPRWEEPTAPEQDFRLYSFFCGAGAYNQQHVYLKWTSFGGVEPVLFATPTYAIDAVPDDTDGAFNSIALTGMSAKQVLVNSLFDPTDGTIVEWSCWRGLCDASSRGVWQFDNGDFRLVTFDVDPTYDGEVNLFRLVDFTAPTPVDTSSSLPEPEWHLSENDEQAETD